MEEPLILSQIVPFELVGLAGAVNHPPTSAAFPPIDSTVYQMQRMLNPPTNSTARASQSFDAEHQPSSAGFLLTDNTILQSLRKSTYWQGHVSHPYVYKWYLQPSILGKCRFPSKQFSDYGYPALEGLLFFHRHYHTSLSVTQMQTSMIGCQATAGKYRSSTQRV